MIQKIDNATVREAVQQAYERCKNETGGKNADYIPYLANVPSNLFGIAACLPDGEVIAVGDSRNDLSMIRYAGTGLAVANACDELKQAANAVACTSDAGVLSYIYHHFVE